MDHPHYLYVKIPSFLTRYPRRVFRWFFPERPTTLSAVTQGDIVLGLQKRHEAFLFLTIKNAAAFKRILKTQLIRDITTTAKVVLFDEEIAAHNRHHPDPEDLHASVHGFNLAFSAVGLAKLGVNVEASFPTDTAFKNGQQADALLNLGDPQDARGGLPTWKVAYTGESPRPRLSAQPPLVGRLLKSLGHSVQLVKRKDGAVRPGRDRGHEHFGYRDGIARPAIKGFNDLERPPGETVSHPGVFLTDLGTGQWTEFGSFMAFRELRQYVPEFDEFVQAAATSCLPDRVSPDFIGARVVGRWKSAPIALAPTQDHPQLGKDPQKRQNFDFKSDVLQEVCPYAAHIRKNNPRRGSAPANIPTGDNLILRAGIPYGGPTSRLVRLDFGGLADVRASSAGPEVSTDELIKNRTEQDRGLFFVCYQSKIENGFQFLQRARLNNSFFPPANAAKILSPGVDLIAGQGTDKGVRTAQGIKPGNAQDLANKVNAPPFVVPRGGEYFFVPSIPGLKHVANLPNVDLHPAAAMGFSEGGARGGVDDGKGVLVV
ncbi:hypothetical protein JCM21900_004246 [Sporobolomyces salmonicolor]